MNKTDIEVKVFKLIAYLEILRKSINISPDEEHPDYVYKDKLNTYYHKLGNIRYDLKKMLGHHLVTDSYIVTDEDYDDIIKEEE